MTAKLVRTAPATLPDQSTRLAIDVIHRIFRGYPGSISFRLWDGHLLSIGSHPSRLTLVFRNPGKFREVMVHRDPLRLAEAHLRGHIEIEGSIYEALRLKQHFQELSLSAMEKAAILARVIGIRASGSASPEELTDNGRSWRAHPNGRHTRSSDKESIAFHYDLSNDFYALWLDEQMVYSCAYFERPDDSLEQAQRQKFDHICRKLRLKPGETLLDIGCGWGGLARWAVRHYGVKAHGITLSRNQYEYGRQQALDQGLAERLTIELRDYRDMPTSDQFDKIVSVGMFEHVGARNLGLYFDTVQRLLKPGGLFLNHGITADRDGQKPGIAHQFINRYVFPDSELVTVGNVQRSMEANGFEILDVESLRPHYALTLRHWVKRLEKCRHEAEARVGATAYRIWRLYMAACSLQFESGEMGIYQVLASRRNRGFSAIPLTRRDLYPPLRRISP